MAIDFKYKVRKCRAIRIEQLTAPEMTAAYKCKIGDERYQYVNRKEADNRTILRVNYVQAVERKHD